MSLIAALFSIGYDGDPIQRLVGSVLEPPEVLLALSPTLIPATFRLDQNCELNEAIRHCCIGQISASDECCDIFLNRSITQVELDGELSLLYATREGDKEFRGLICIDFGSLTDWIVATFSLQFFLTTLIHLRDQYSFILVTHKQFYAFITGFDIAYNQLSISERNGLLLIEGDVNHSSLIRKCVTVISHGGIGTVNTCLRVGIPQGSYLYIIFVEINLEFVLCSS